MREVSKRTARCTGLTHTHALTAGCSRTSCPRPGQWRSRQSSTLQRRGGAGKTGSGWREAGVGGPHTYPPVSQPSARCMQAQRRPVTPLPPSCCHPPSHQARCPARHRRTCRPPPPPPPTHTHTHTTTHPPGKSLGFMDVTGFCSTLVLERISLNTAPCRQAGKAGGAGPRRWDSRGGCLGRVELDQQAPQEHKRWQGGWGRGCRPAG